ncbi:MAG: DUF1775 domain-containing protein [Hyphomicrobiaceae bacterium]|nr:DUF1775 domain-containing protein [Hyphomicrobiaceae bacterium]
MDKRTIKQAAGLTAAIVISLCAAASLARAHAVLEQREAKVGAGYKAVVKIGHGCDGSPTTTVRVDIPEGVIGVKPMPKPGWTITMQRGAYKQAYKHYHGDLSEGVRQVTWTGGRLPDDFYDEFVVSTYIAGELTPETTLFFPVTQTCEKGELAWTEIPAAGQDAHDLKSPAATLKLIANVKTAGAGSKAAQPSSPIQVEQPWSRATPAGTTVAGGYVKLTNTGKAPDRLIGGTFARAKSVEVHIMTSEMGVMKMRQVPEGVELPPGVPVELKPGGLHLMLLGLSEGLKAGETVKGTLTFEKAGPVDVEFTIAPLGAEAPSAGGGHEGHQH